MDKPVHPGPRERPLGGFFALEPPLRSGRGYLALWGARDRTRAFRNARSAFRALLDVHREGSVWLPAFICREMAAAVPAGRLRFYQVGQRLVPDLEALGREARPRDVVLAVAYFGRPPPATFQDFCRLRPDLVIVEDRAQALDPGLKPWAPWRLYSPRKLAGVADGGLLLPGAGALSPVWDALRTSPADNPSDVLLPALARYEDDGAGCNEAWHGLHKDREEREGVGRERMSRLSWDLLDALDGAAHATARRGNFEALALRLRDWMMFPDEPVGPAPFGFPAQVPAERRAALLEALYRQRIFPAVHWVDLPSPPDVFPDEHRLSRSILTLPCDHRYGEDDMARIARAFVAAAR